jgi:SnoaL-like domain
MDSAPPDQVARTAILDILALYCHAIDRRRWDLMEQCFHPDASFSFGPVDGSWREFVTIARTMIDPLPLTHHQLGQSAFVFDGDLASVETYLTATHRIPADAPAEGVFPGHGVDYHAIIAGRYVDQFERRDGQWRIAVRVGTIDWRHDHDLPADAPPFVPLQPDPAAAFPFAVNASASA